MDTEEHLELQEARRLGRPQTDEGPYYHPSWWESYKGSIKGKLGGAIIGALMGAAIGVAAAMLMPLVSGVALTAGALAMTVSGFSAAGMLYGAHEFADVGRITGAVAAAHEKAEERIKAFEEGKFAQLENKIDKLQATITGQPVPQSAETEDKGKEAGAAATHTQAEIDYKTSHCDEEHCFSPEEKPRLIFWKVALVGLAVGLAAGALLATGGLAGHILAELGVAAASGGALPTAGVYAASMLTMGLFGASFGINRDLFRHVFDKTDLWFRGIIGKNKSPDPIAPTHARQTGHTGQGAEKKEEICNSPVETVVYEGHAQYPASETYHRDKVMASARQALLSLDHTKVIPH